MPKCLHISANQYPDIKDVNFTKNIWIELAKGFDEYHVVGRSYQNKFLHYSENNIHLHLVPGFGSRERSFFFSSLYIFHLIKKYNITHLLAQSSILGGFSAALASKFYKIPLMAEVHGEQYFRYFEKKNILDKIFSGISKYTFNSAQKVRSLNLEMTKKLEREGIKNITEIPIRVDFKIFNKKKNSFVIHPPLRLISVGRFVKEKNYLNLIQILAKSNIDFHLTLVGGGPLQSEYEKYIYESGISDKIKLISWLKQEDLLDIVTLHDIYIQYSISEGMPRAIVEAMALKMPIIATDVGSISGVLVNQYNSLLVKHDDSDMFIQALRYLSEDIEFRVRIANQAYMDASQKYEWNMVFNKYRSEILSMKA